MIFILAAVILAFIFNSQLMMGEWFDTFVDFVLGSLMFVFFVVIFALVGGVIGMLIGTAFDKTSVLVDSQQIVSMRDAVGISGNFYLGSGGVHDNPKFYYYQKTKDNGFVFSSVDADDAVVYQDEKINPRIDMYANQFNHTAAWIIGIPTGFDNYKIHIPPNSIIQNFNLNMGRN